MVITDAEVWQESRGRLISSRSADGGTMGGHWTDSALGQRLALNIQQRGTLYKIYWHGVSINRRALRGNELVRNAIFPRN